MSKFNFDLSMPLEKATNDEGRWILKGVAAGTGIDLQNERLAPELVEKFAAQIKQQSVPFLNWHNKNDALAEMGEVVKAWVTPNFDLGVEVELDQEDYRAQKLWKKLDTINPRTGENYQYGMSVYGKVHDYKDEYEKSAGRVRTFYDATLEEVSLTTKPIYTPSFGTVLKKAADAAHEGDMSEKSETPNSTEKVVVEEIKVETVVETPASDQHVSEPETPADGEKVVEKAMSTKTKTDAKKIRQLVDMHRQMSTLIAELVLSDDETASADSVATEAVVAVKSEMTADSGDVLQKAVDEITRLTAEVGELKARIPATPEPEVLVKKSDQDEAAELFKSLSTSDRLRLALAVSHNGK